MGRIESKLRPSDPAFAANRARMQGLVDERRERLAWARAGAPEETRTRARERGKLLPRERVEALLDPGTAYLELSPLAAYGLYGGDAPAAGIITGIGTIQGRQVVI